MADFVQLSASLLWLILGVLTLWRLREWDKKFSELYEEFEEILKDG